MTLQAKAYGTIYTTKLTLFNGLKSVATGIFIGI